MCRLLTLFCVFLWNITRFEIEIQPKTSVASRARPWAAKSFIQAFVSLGGWGWSSPRRVVGGRDQVCLCFAQSEPPSLEETTCLHTRASHSIAHGLHYAISSV